MQYNKFNVTIFIKSIIFTDTEVIIDYVENEIRSEEGRFVCHKMPYNKAVKALKEERQQWYNKVDIRY
jgi:hypothetical protein